MTCKYQTHLDRPIQLLIHLTTHVFGSTFNSVDDIPVSAAAAAAAAVWSFVLRRSRGVYVH